MSINVLKLVFARFCKALSSTHIRSPDLDLDPVDEGFQAARGTACSQALRRDLALYANLTEPNL